MPTLRNLFQSQFSELKIETLPDASIFEKLSAYNDELPDYIFDQAINLQRLRHCPPELYKEQQASLASTSWKTLLKASLENMGLGFLFNQKASPAISETPPPKRPERTVEQNKVSKISKPGPISRAAINKDNFTLDVTLIGDDLRRSITSYLGKYPSAVSLTDTEKKSLVPCIG